MKAHYVCPAHTIRYLEELEREPEKSIGELIRERIEAMIWRDLIDPETDGVQVE